MTGMQGILLIVAGPVLAVVLALVANARPIYVVGAALLGELAVYGIGRVLSYRALHQVGLRGQGMLIAQSQARGSQRLLAFVIVLAFALLVGATGLGVRMAIQRSGR